MQQFRFTNSSSVRCTATSSGYRVTGCHTTPSTAVNLASGAGHADVATTSAENCLRRQVLQAAAAAALASAVLPLAASAAPQQAAAGAGDSSTQEGR